MVLRTFTPLANFASGTNLFLVLLLEASAKSIKGLNILSYSSAKLSSNIFCRAFDSFAVLFDGDEFPKVVNSQWLKVIEEEIN